MPLAPYAPSKRVKGCASALGPRQLKADAALKGIRSRSAAARGRLKEKFSTNLFSTCFQPLVIDSNDFHTCATGWVPPRWDNRPLRHGGPKTPFPLVPFRSFGVHGSATSLKRYSLNAFCRLGWPFYNPRFVTD